MKKLLWVVFVFFCILMGIFPFLSYGLKVPFGVESLKSNEVLNDWIWKINFHTHIILGAFSLLTGWVQFMPRFRSKFLKFHRNIGKIYIISVLVSGISGYPIWWHASGGISAFIALGSILSVWLMTTILAYHYIRIGDITLHKKWMMYSYACTFASVTLRIWLPSLTLYFGDFDKAYDIATWLAIIPNLVVVKIFFDKSDKLI